MKALTRLGVKSCLSSIVSNPKLYSRFRLIKKLAEGLPEPVSKAEAAYMYGDLISRVKATVSSASNTAELFSTDYKLYVECLACPHWHIVKTLCLSSTDMNKNNYFYWTDGDLVSEAGKFRNLTHLKNAAGSLHRELTGRDLLEEVQRLHPSYSTNCYIGHEGKCYRSQGELVLGNLILLSGVAKDWGWQVATGLYRNGSNKTMTADFRLNPLNLYIEITMFRDNPRGSRGVHYENRRIEKEKLYEANGCKHVFIDSSGFYKNGVIDAEKFARHCISTLQQYGFHGLKKSLASSKKITFHEGVDSKPELKTEEYLDYLEKKFGLTHAAQLSNDKSYLNFAINIREDGHYIRALLKERGFKIRAEKISQKHQARRKTLVPFETIRRFARSKNFRNQSEWYAFCKSEAEDIKRKGFCSNVPSVYRNIGWTNWYDFLGNEPRRGHRYS